MSCCGGNSNNRSEQGLKKKSNLQTDSHHAADASNTGSGHGANKWFHIIHWIIMFGFVVYFIVSGLKK
ncbi:MAG: hypothetical protein HZC05_02560 [Candidatus Magasanikbacteria bacterium]|nr:hypothetical protein [Candidatus Magasanikbacteria bacterium]